METENPLNQESSPPVLPLWKYPGVKYFDDGSIYWSVFEYQAPSGTRPVLSFHYSKDKARKYEEDAETAHCGFYITPDKSHYFDKPGSRTNILEILYEKIFPRILKDMKHNKGDMLKYINFYSTDERSRKELGVLKRALEQVTHCYPQEHSRYKKCPFTSVAVTLQME